MYIYCVTSDANPNAKRTQLDDTTGNWHKVEKGLQSYSQISSVKKSQLQQILCKNKEKRAATTTTAAAAQVFTNLPKAPGWWDALRAVDYCTLNCPRWNAGGGAGGASPALGCRSKAGAGARAGEEQLCLGIQTLPITMPRLSFHALLYDTL